MGGDEDEDETSGYSLRMENLSTAEKTNILHEAYQFLVKKYVPKEERQRMKAEKEAESDTAVADLPEKIDSALDFSHLH